MADTGSRSSAGSWINTNYIQRQHNPFSCIPYREQRLLFVGFSKHVGHALTYKILTTVTHKVIHHSVIPCASDQCNLQINPNFQPTQTATPDFLTSPNNNALCEGRSLPTINPVDADSVFKQVEKENGEQDDSSDNDDERLPLVRRPDDSDDKNDEESPYAARHCTMLKAVLVLVRM
jgi:hypothetical protein